MLIVVLVQSHARGLVMMRGIACRGLGTEGKFSTPNNTIKQNSIELCLIVLSSGGRIRTDDLRVMSPTSYHCSTPHLVTSSIEIGCKSTTFF